jgi:PmbA protein
MVKEKYIRHLQDTTVNIVNSRIESIRYKNITRTSIRLYHDGYIGVAGAIGDYDEERLTQEAAEALGRRIEYPAEPSINFSKNIDTQARLPENNFLKEMEALLDELSGRFGNFIFSNKISIVREKHHMHNECGLNLEYSDKAFRLELVFKDRASSNLFDGYFAFDERRYDRAGILDRMGMVLEAYPERVGLPGKGRHPVVFFRNEFPVGKLASDLRGDIFATGGSLFSGKLGQKLFNEGLTFRQALDPEEVRCTPFFDAEGTVNPGYTYNFIENGILMSPYTDKRTAAKYGLAHTGSASAAYDGVPTLDFQNFSFSPSDKTVKELLGGAPGILVLVASGGDFTPEGRFASPVQLAMLFDGNKLVGRLPELNISSDIFTMLGGGFRGMGKDTPFPYSSDKMVVVDMNVEEA